ncbi:hypothetical protein ACFOHS_00730 [Jhaorihella thermophila]
MTDRLPTYFISHGGGPWPWLPQLRAQLAELETALAAMARENPRAAGGPFGFGALGNRRRVRGDARRTPANGLRLLRLSPGDV